MTFEALSQEICRAMENIGYERVASLAFKARWSPKDVQHFVYFLEQRKERHILNGSFGMRNEEAEKFGVLSIRNYGGEIFKIWEHNETIDCSMRADLGRLSRRHWPLPLMDVAPHLSARQLRDYFTNWLIPEARQIATADQFMALLVDDRPLLPWVTCNGALRAAQIVALGCLSGANKAEIECLLKDRHVRIANGLSKTSHFRSSPSAFIRQLLNDWHGGS